MENQYSAQFLSLRKQYIQSCFGKLNEMQLQAVCKVQGPLLILAGAGSGKTTVLVNRIANIVRFGIASESDQIYGSVELADLDELQACITSGEKPSVRLENLLSVGRVRPYNVLAITFTNKAAGELKARLQRMLGEDGLDIQASTFHSACVRILRRESERIGFPRDFTIYDMDDQQRMMKDVFKQLTIDDKFLSVKSCLNAISSLKDKLVTPQEAQETAKDARTGLVAKAYTMYQRRLRETGAMDFDDLIFNTVQLLRQDEEARLYYQNRFKYILVDEYQDTSVAQFMLVYLLASGHHNICVVGDDDQSIYRFRGATIENILSFESQFPGAVTIRLEQNYRSTSNILNAANCVIENNMARKGKTLWTENGSGQKVHCYVANDEFDEAGHIAQVIGEHLREGAKLRDHAILYRMNAQSNPIETYFARAGVPYRILAGHRFFDRKEVKDIIAYMSIVVNPRDDVRLRRIINEPARKIGATTVENIASIARNENTDMLHIIRHASEYTEISRAAAALQKFAEMYQKLTELSDTMPLDAFVNELVSVTGYRAMLEAAGEEGKTRLENIGQLVSAVKTYADQNGPSASLQGYLEEVALISDIDSYDEEADTAVMMTMHAAKGLEFPYVFIVGLEEGVFPGEMSRYSDDYMQEERRLCYVGITRAKKELYLSRAGSRMLYGQTRRNPESRFLREIEEQYLDVEYSDEMRRAKERNESRYTGAQEIVFSRSSLLGNNPYADTRAFSDNANVYGGKSYAGGGAGQKVAPRSASTTTAPVKNAAPPKFTVGDAVVHKVFGNGTVQKVTPTANDAIVEVLFDTVGIKKTMANYAPMTIAGVQEKGETE